MLDRKRFVIWWSIAFAVGAFYPSTVAHTLHWKWDLVGRWLVNDVMYTLYMVAIFPFLVGSLASILHLKHLKSVTRGIRYPLCSLLFLFAFLVSWQGAESVLQGKPRSVVPVMLSSDRATEAYGLDMCNP